MKNYQEKMNEILVQNNGIISRKEVIEKGIASNYFTKFIKEKGLIKINKSEYIEESYFKDDYYLLQRRFPKVVFSGYSALYFHKLIDFMPKNTEITISKNYRIKKEFLNLDVKVHIENNDDFFNIGNIYITNDYGNELFVYSKEKVIVEMIRKKDQYDENCYINALKNFLKSRDKDFELLFEYAKLRNIEKKVYEIFELLAN